MRKKTLQKTKTSQLDLVSLTQTKVGVLIEKLEKITNKKVKLVESEDSELIYPNKLYHVIKSLDKTLTQFDIENIKQLALNIMADNKIIDKKALKLIITNYKNNLKNVN
jgi:hypothetical protein